MAQIILKIEGLEELTKAMIVLAGAVMDYQAFREKGVAKMAQIDLKAVAPSAQEQDDSQVDSDVELAVRDMYYFNKSTNGMIMIKKGQPIDVTSGYKATTKAKYDEYYGDDKRVTDDPVQTPDDDAEYTPADDVDVPWKVDGEDEDEVITMEDLRAQLVALGKVKGKEAAKKIISDLGAAQLTELDPALYGEAMDTAKALLGK